MEVVPPNIKLYSKPIPVFRFGKVVGYVKSRVYKIKSRDLRTKTQKHRRHRDEFYEIERN